MLESGVIVIITAVLPIVELRGAIPLGLTVYDLPVLFTYVLAVIGTMLPVLVLLRFWTWFEKVLISKVPYLEKIKVWLFERTRRKFYQRYRKYGDLALVVFVAVPLPVTGVWTGSLAAYLFGVPYWRAFRLILVGALISGAVVTLVTLGLIKIF